MELPQAHGSHYEQGKVGDDVPEVRHAEESAFIGKAMVTLILMDRRQQQQCGKRSCHQAEKENKGAARAGACQFHSIKPVCWWSRDIRPHQPARGGKFARIRSEKSEPPSAACAASFIRERCRNSS